MKFDTSEYVRSHGKEPRGYGYWAFQFKYGPAHIRDQIYFRTGTLTQCRKQLKAEFPFIKTAFVLP